MRKNDYSQSVPNQAPPSFARPIVDSFCMKDIRNNFGDQDMNVINFGFRPAGSIASFYKISEGTNT